MTETLNHNNPEKKSSILKWTFWDNAIDYSLYPAQRSKKVVINIHGTYGDKNGTNDKYEILAKQLQAASINSVIYASSRNSQIDTNISDSYEKKKSYFNWKTFKDELEDARRVIKQTLTIIHEELWVNNNQLEIIINGNSLWGIIAFYLASEFPQIKAISTVWTGIPSDKFDIPVLDTLPESTEIQEVISKFKGRCTMHQALADDVFSYDSYQDFYKSLTTSDKNIVSYADVGHSFRTVDGIASTQPYEKVLERLIELILWGDLQDRIIYLDNKVEKVKDVLSNINMNINIKR